MSVMEIYLLSVFFRALLSCRRSSSQNEESIKEDIEGWHGNLINDGQNFFLHPSINLSLQGKLLNFKF